MGLDQAALAIVFNVVASVALVLVNKILVMKYDFHCMAILTAFHFSSSIVATSALVYCGLIPYKSVNDYLSIFRIALGSLLSIVFMNYCLANSSISFYQISKLFCIPVTLFLEYIFQKQQQQWNASLIVSLIMIVFGVALVVAQEVETSFRGVFWASLGVITTSASQVFFGPLQKGLGLDPLQLLFHTSPWLLVGATSMVPLFDNMAKVSSLSFNSSVTFYLAASCLLSVVFNVSNYQVLSLASPTTYNVIGHVKTLAVILTAYYTIGVAPTIKMIVGMSIAMTGVSLYRMEMDNQSRVVLPIHQPEQLQSANFSKEAVKL